jgi:hypothetical protein
LPCPESSEGLKNIDQTNQFTFSVNGSYATASITFDIGHWTFQRSIIAFSSGFGDVNPVSHPHSSNTITCGAEGFNLDLPSIYIGRRICQRLCYHATSTVNR